MPRIISLSSAIDLMEQTPPHPRIFTLYVYITAAVIDHHDIVGVLSAVLIQHFSLCVKKYRRHLKLAITKEC